jgi:hypothetical protein
MPDNPHKSAPHMRTSTRGKGEKLTKAEKQLLQEKFLKSFSITANMRAACMAAGIDRSTVYYWQEHDTEFSLRFNIAEQEANDVIRAELFRRAVQGYEKPLTSMGKLVYNKDGKVETEKVYSDTLLSLLAKSRLPEFREKQAEIEVNVHTGNISEELRMLPSEQLSQLKSWIADAKAKEPLR